ncbi:MAG TPA: hypothetical protein VJ521_09925, partial [Acidobacteriota bacterium]|nr:hypothetical protein [Acidobacteriota bacterium]
TERQKKEAEFTALLQDGIQKFSSKDWDTALACFQKLDELSPGNRQVQQYISLSQEKSRQLASIRQKLRSSLDESQNQLRNQNWDEAIRICRTALQGDFSDFPVAGELLNLQSALDSTFAARKEAFLRKAIEMTQAEKLDEAEPLFQQILVWDPQNAAALEGLRRIEGMRSAAADLIAPPPPVSAPFPLKKLAILSAPVVLVLLIVGIWLALKKPAPAPPPPPAVPSGVVNINALPWARIKITPLSKEIQLPSLGEEESMTPCNLILPAGEYSMVLENGVSKLVINRITVKAGAATAFSYTMPGYDAKKALAEIARQE